MSSAAAFDKVRAKSAVLVEELIRGTELTIGVVEEGCRCVSLPASEVRVERGGMFDFAGKYLGKGTREITPAEVPRGVTDAAALVAIAAHRALGCGGSRAAIAEDFRPMGPGAARRRLP